MNKLKVGDKIKRIIDNGAINVTYGKIYTFLGYDEYNKSRLYILNDNGEKDWFNVYNFELVEQNIISNNKLNIMEKFITMFLSEPEKSFRKAGITNGDGIITEDGTKMLLTWLLKKNGGDFKTEVVDELLKEEDK